MQLDRLLVRYIVDRYNYDPWDITTVQVYQQTSPGEQSVARAHATELETGTLSYREAQAISGRLQRIGKPITNEFVAYHDH